MKRGGALALALLAACSSSSSSEGAKRGLGVGCTDASECAASMSCLPALVNNQCTSQKTCTDACKVDVDCQILDSRAKCFAGCDNTKICLLTP